MYSKSEIIKRKILGDIRSSRLAGGTRIPSRHELMKTFSCSRSCADRAVSELIKDSYLSARRGSGTFVNEKSPLNMKHDFSRVYFICNSIAANNLVIAGAKLQKSIECVTMFRHDTVNNLKELSKSGNAIVWDLPGYSSLMHIDYLATLGIPQLLLGRIFRDYEYVTTDSKKGISEGLRWFKSHGISKIAFIGREAQTKYPYLAGRELDFYASSIENAVSIAPEHLFIDNFSDNSAGKIAGVVKALAGGKNFPRGIYIENISLVPWFLAACEKINKYCGRDFFLLAFDYSRDLDGTPGLCMLKQDYAKMSEFVEQWVLSSGRRQIYKKIPPVLMG